MKALFISLFCTISFGLFAQTTPPDTTQYKNVKLFKVTLNSGKVFVGNIINQDPKEVLIETKEVGQVLIPKYEISLIEEIPEHDLGVGGVYKPSETFATRYFITTNGLPIKKGDSYIQWNLYGPDFQYGVTDHFGIGIMTTWLGVPIIA